MVNPKPDSPAQVAESFASEWNTAEAPLDFSPASLHVVGALVLRLLNGSGDNASDSADELVRASCYMGEVVRRTLGGEWASAGGGADMLHGVAGRASETGIVIPLSDLMLVISGPDPSLVSWYQAIASGIRP